ncbi:transcription elongation factor S-II [Xylaria venustula]|nr:transcription elongation factor S-II [Xylaria venustula]
MPNPTRAELLEAAEAFCKSFAQKKPLEEILSHFSSSRSGAREDDDGDDRSGGSGGGILIHEHGLPQLAPFLGRDYRGPEGAREYFETLGKFLSYEDMRFVEFVVDASEGEGGGKVVARGKARFTWTETGNSWDETFVYVLLFDAHAKVLRYEVWADSGAAYLASRGQL